METIANDAGKGEGETVGTVAAPPVIHPQSGLIDPGADEDAERAAWNQANVGEPFEPL